ncbi:hypothetical protein PMAYCL1PPCAC_01935, partial [Pristionchus mayeri]
SNFACAFDGVEYCSENVPFSSCPDASFCAARFYDGKCDEQCNTEACLFDGRDCEGAEPESRKNGTMTELSLILRVPPETFVVRIDDFLKSLGERLRTTVIVKKTEGEMDVFEWNNKTGEGRRVGFGSRTDARFEYSRRTKRFADDEAILYGTLVVIKVDLSECSVGCFSDIHAVAQFIEAMEAIKPLDPSMPIHEAIIDKRRSGTGSSSSSLLPWIFLVVAVIAAVAVAGTVRMVGGKRCRVIEDAPEWTPP